MPFFFNKDKAVYSNDIANLPPKISTCHLPPSPQTPSFNWFRWSLIFKWEARVSELRVRKAASCGLNYIAIFFSILNKAYLSILNSARKEYTLKLVFNYKCSSRNSPNSLLSLLANQTPFSPIEIVFIAKIIFIFVPLIFLSFLTLIFFFLTFPQNQ